MLIKKITPTFLLFFLSFLCILGIFPLNASAKSIDSKSNYTIHAEKEEDKKKTKEDTKNAAVNSIEQMFQNVAEVGNSKEFQDKSEDAKNHTAVDKNGKHISLKEQNRDANNDEKFSKKLINTNTGIIGMAGIADCREYYGNDYVGEKYSQDRKFYTNSYLQGGIGRKGKQLKKAKKTEVYKYIKYKFSKDVYNSYGYKTFDDMLTAIYGDGETKKKMAIVFRDKNKQNKFGYYNKERKLWLPNWGLFAEAIRCEVDGVLAKVEISVDIDNSTSVATGDDVYAGDETVPDSNVIYDTDADTLESSLTSLLIGGGDSINKLIGKCNASLERIIYGRIVVKATNYFSFELVKGNPYGILGSYIYGIFRSIAIPVLLLIALAQITKAGWISRTAEQRNVFKDVLGKSIVVILLLFFIPVIMDTMIAFKDIMLSEISKQLAPDLATLFNIDTSDNNSIINIYRNNANDGKRLFDGLLYLAICFVTLFYFVTYISTAFAVMISFMFFPLLAIFSITDNKLLDNWLKEMIGNVFVPVLDAVLLLMPVLLQSLITENEMLRNFIILIACYSVISSRALIRRMLGVGGNVGSEILGFGAMMGTARMLSGIRNKVIGGAGNLVGALGEANNHRKQAHMYADLARANGEGGQLDGSFGKLGKIGKAGKLAQLKSIFDEEVENGKGKKDGETEDGLKNENVMGSAVEDQKLDSVNAEEVTNGAVDSITDDGTGGLDVSSTNEDGIDAVNEGLSADEQKAVDINNVLKQHANVDNFENPEFRNAFNFAERAKLHKQKANRTAVYGFARATGSAVGSVAGGGLGGAILGGATMMAGPSANVMAVATGVNYGSQIGGYVGRNTVNAAATGGMYVGTKMNPTNFRASYHANYDPSTTQSRPKNLTNYVPPRPQPQRTQQQTHSNPYNYNPNNSHAYNSPDYSVLDHSKNSTASNNTTGTNVQYDQQAMSDWISNFTQDNEFSEEQATAFENDMKILNVGQGDEYNDIMKYYEPPQENVDINIATERKQARAIVNKLVKEKGLELDNAKYNDLVDKITMERKNGKTGKGRNK